MSNRSVVHYRILNAKAATGSDTTYGIDVRDFRNCVVSIGTASSANLTCKAQGAIALASASNTPPDFTAAQTVANNWDYIQMVDLNDGSPVSGDTGFVASGTDDFRLFEVNINALDYINFTVTARSAGSVTVTCTLTDNT